MYSVSLGVMTNMRQWREESEARLMMRKCRHGCGCRGVRRQLVLGHVRHAVVLLPLHPPVLEPDLDLSLGETELVRDLDASPAGEVAVEVELLLQLQRLVASVRRTSSLAVAAVDAVNSFRTKTQTNRHAVIITSDGQSNLT